MTNNSIEDSAILVIGEDFYKKIQTMNKCIITIPVYKQQCTAMELASFRQCLSVLKDYDFCFITYKELDVSLYTEVAKAFNKDIYAEYFDKSYFSSVTGYNKLCLTKDLYERFVHKYEYMLIYQLDAWVFRDELQYWCDKGYDYIGAPWFKNISADETRPVYTKTFDGVGNGGFTLRRIQYCIDVLNCNHFFPYIKPNLLWKMSWHNQKVIKGYNFIITFLVILLKVALKTIGYRNSIYWFLHDTEKVTNEDYVFSLFASHSNLVMPPCIPNVLEAASFSFEVNPSYLYEKIGRLPFGCHAFEKWEYDDFWKKYIKI